MDFFRQVNVRDLKVGNQYAEVYGRQRVDFTINELPTNTTTTDGDVQWSAIAIKPSGENYRLMETVGLECYRVGHIVLVSEGDSK